MISSQESVSAVERARHKVQIRESQSEFSITGELASLKNIKVNYSQGICLKGGIIERIFEKIANFLVTIRVFQSCFKGC